ncbi:MAG: P-II family nitrogen regulator [Deinococcales bacterium]
MAARLKTVETYRGTTVKMELSDKIKLDIGVSDSFVDTTVQAIMNAARTWVMLVMVKFFCDSC